MENEAEDPKGRIKERMEESMSDVLNVSEIFGKNVFNDAVMKDRLPKNVYKKLKKTVEDGAELDPSIADVVAHAMKDWAIERGATHYTHWFQPLTGVTAEKHDSFISAPSDGKVIMEFSGKELIKMCIRDRGRSPGLYGNGHCQGM